MYVSFLLADRGGLACRALRHVAIPHVASAVLRLKGELAVGGRHTMLVGEVRLVGKGRRGHHLGIGVAHTVGR